jgi:hypothetical protein
MAVVDGYKAGDHVSTVKQEMPRPWTVRYHWRAAPGVVHPAESVIKFASESEAIDAAVTKMDASTPNGSVTLVRVEYQGPDGEWHDIQ